MKSFTKMIIARVILSLWAFVSILFINFLMVELHPEIPNMGRLTIDVILWFTFVGIMNRYLLPKQPPKNDKDNFTPNTPAI